MGKDGINSNVNSFEVLLNGASIDSGGQFGFFYDFPLAVPQGPVPTQMIMCRLLSLMTNFQVNQDTFWCAQGLASVLLKPWAKLAYLVWSQLVLKYHLGRTTS
jgi:hypothetical protein